MCEGVVETCNGLKPHPKDIQKVKCKHTKSPTPLNQRSILTAPLPEGLILISSSMLIRPMEDRELRFLRHSSVKGQDKQLLS